MSRLILKCKHVAERMWHERKVFFSNCKQFGVHVAIFMAYDHIFLRPKCFKYMSVIYSYLEHFLNPILRKYLNPENSTWISPIKPLKFLEKKPIWFCWLQGKDNIPELVNLCYKSLLISIPDETEVHFISLDNITDYVSLDATIWNKFKSGKIKYAFFSDIIRYHLLRDYGGLWIDSTIFVSKKIPIEWFSSDFYSMKMHEINVPHEACKGLWTNFCFSGKAGCIVFNYVCDALNYYWKNNDCEVDYVFLDYIILTGYNNIKSIKNIINAVPFNNENVWRLKELLNSSFNYNEYLNCIDDNTFHKLSHQNNYLKNTATGEQTFYGYLIEHVINQNTND